MKTRRSTKVEIPGIHPSHIKEFLTKGVITKESLTVLLFRVLRQKSNHKEAKDAVHAIVKVLNGTFSEDTLGAILESNLKKLFPDLCGNTNTSGIKLFLSGVAEQADEVINTIRYLLLGEDLQNVLALVSETSSMGSNLAHIFIKLSQFEEEKNELPEENKIISPRLRFELIRKLLLMVLIMQRKNYETTHLDQTIQAFDELFNTKIFTGQIGEINDSTFYAIHNSRTNAVVTICQTIEEARERLKKGQHIKRHEQSTRSARIGSGVKSQEIPVLYISRRKTHTSATAKALHLKRGDAEYTTHRFSDSTGCMLVVPDGNDLIIMNHIKRLIKEKFGKNCTIEIKNNVGTTGDRGQSKDVRYQRIIVRVNGNSGHTYVPFEIMVINQTDHLNNNFRVERKNGVHEQAHPLFLSRRNMKNIFLFNPEYMGGKISLEDLKEKCQLHYERKRRGLLKAHRVE